ncbi:unnamed protein product [Lampetra planeri]
MFPRDAERCCSGPTSSPWPRRRPGRFKIHSSLPPHRDVITKIADKRAAACPLRKSRRELAPPTPHTLSQPPLGLVSASSRPPLGLLSASSWPLRVSLGLLSGWPGVLGAGLLVAARRWLRASSAEWWRDVAAQPPRHRPPPAPPGRRAPAPSEAHCGRRATSPAPALPLAAAATLSMHSPLRAFRPGRLRADDYDAAAVVASASTRRQSVVAPLPQQLQQLQQQQQQPSGFTGGTGPRIITAAVVGGWLGDSPRGCAVVPQWRHAQQESASSGHAKCSGRSPNSLLPSEAFSLERGCPWQEEGEEEVAGAESSRFRLGRPPSVNTALSVPPVAVTPTAALWECIVLSAGGGDAGGGDAGGRDAGGGDAGGGDAGGSDAGGHVARGDCPWPPLAVAGSGEGWWITR